jgi:hypothetical protein
MIVQLVLICVAATVLASWLGWGLARLSLPRALAEYSGLLAPLLGYALAIVLGFWFVWTATSLLVPLLLGIVLAGLLNLLAWRRTGPPRLIALLREWPILLLSAITVLLGVLPLLHYGHMAIIGGGWDIETALPTVRYLERGPIAAIASQPSNPLRDLVSIPPRIGKTLGFALWQGQIDLLLQIEAILTFVPLMAWMRALGVLAVYLLLRVSFGLGRTAAWFGAAWTSANALLLWIIYFNFEKQISAWPLIPLGLLICLAAAEDLAERLRGATWASVLRQHWPILLTAGMVVASQVIAYYAALTLWLPLLVGLALAVLCEQWFVRRATWLAEWGRLLGAAGLVALVTTLFSIPAIIDYWNGFSYRYDEQITTLGVFRYIPLSDIAGITPYLHGLSTNPAASSFTQSMIGLLVLLALAALFIPRKNADHEPSAGSQATPLRWWGMLLGMFAYLAWLRYLQQYPYAYMKGASYGGFVFVCIAAAGWQALFSRIKTPWRWATLILPIALSIPLIQSQHQVIAKHWDQPGLYPNDYPALLELRERIPAGSTVMLADDTRTEGVTSGLASYLLDHTTVWGHVKTGYTSGGGGAPDSMADYALLPRAEDPLAWGYGRAIWQAGSFALYQRDPAALAHLRLSTIIPSQGQTQIAVGDANLALGAQQLVGNAPRQLRLIVASQHNTTLTINQREWPIPAGVHQLILAHQAGQALSIENSSENNVLLRAVTLLQSNDLAEGLSRLDNAMVASVRSEFSENTLKVDLSSLQPSAGPVTIALDIWDTDQSLHYGWYGIEFGASEQTRSATLQLDLASGQAQALDEQGNPLPFGASFDGLRTGNYRARLQISAGAALLNAPGTIAEFSIDANQQVFTRNTSQIPLLMSTLDRPLQQFESVQIARDTKLLGYALDRQQASAGQSLLLTLWWQALAASGDERSVLVHLLDAQGNPVVQADGAPARGGWPTSLWQSNNLILDTRSIDLPADLPAGQYTLAIGMYRWPSLERLPMSDQGQQPPDDVIRIPIVVQ